jgi:hypothetical protein
MTGDGIRLACAPSIQPCSPQYSEPLPRTRHSGEMSANTIPAPTRQQIDYRCRSLSESLLVPMPGRMRSHLPLKYQLMAFSILINDSRQDFPPQTAKRESKCWKTKCLTAQNPLSLSAVQSRSDFHFLAGNLNFTVVIASSAVFAPA